jgi:hypothetical protein
MDINYMEDDKSISPPWKFLETSFLQKLVDLGSETCLIALNILYYSNESKKKVFDNINALKADKKCMFESSENNKVFFLTKGSNISLQEVPENVKSLENMLKTWKNQNKGLWLKEMGMADHIKDFKAIIN